MPLVSITFGSQVYVVDYTDLSGNTCAVGVTDSLAAAETLIMRRYILADDAAEYADFFGRHRVAAQALWTEDRPLVP